jgi:hypothetical protein
MFRYLNLKLPNKQSLLSKIIYNSRALVEEVVNDLLAWALRVHLRLEETVRLEVFQKTIIFDSGLGFLELSEFLRLFE